MRCSLSIWDDSGVIHELPAEDLIAKVVDEVITTLDDLPLILKFWDRVKWVFHPYRLHVSHHAAIDAAVNKVVADFKSRTQRA